MSALARVVRVTLAAKAQLLQLLHKHESQAALFSVEGGGCNGLRYRLQPTHEAKSKLDEEVPLGDDRVLRVCGKSLVHVMGTEIDWKDDFMGESFHFENPNTASTCGCGSTFAPRDVE